ncbi:MULTISPECIES: translation initiation factor IF-2 [Thermaerobacter]|uniref:Translation initiation factor IF-2 n=1 Tax=Thermaerobacter composti TaxID=554949 RepID=A0ABZ0QLM0_9FIRM|nr:MULTISPECIES: translation initiation factor IF-2 [Thermaerobacter]PZN06512.1 MAG: translation initiation factor IF-2 [Bacillota bacterium]QBS38311.1 translation initiation factor IF-2 [Thermaerobacter sp. FW80]WPD18387.1 translation initiation factor IF-2 [Thermaerobacter composti]
MTTYAKLLRAAATLKRVRAGLDSLAARAQTEEERERLRRAAAQARVMEQGLERRIRQVAAEEPEYARQSPGGALMGEQGAVADGQRSGDDRAGDEGGTPPSGSREGARRPRGTGEAAAGEATVVGRGTAGGRGAAGGRE